MVMYRLGKVLFQECKECLGTCGTFLRRCSSPSGSWGSDSGFGGVICCKFSSEVRRKGRNSGGRRQGEFFDDSDVRVLGLTIFGNQELDSKHSDRIADCLQWELACRLLFHEYKSPG